MIFLQVHTATDRWYEVQFKKFQLYVKTKSILICSEKGSI